MSREVLFSNVGTFLKHVVRSCLLASAKGTCDRTRERYKPLMAMTESFLVDTAARYWEPNRGVGGQNMAEGENVKAE